jgi:hypothetical protein
MSTWVGFRVPLPPSFFFTLYSPQCIQVCLLMLVWDLWVLYIPSTGNQHVGKALGWLGTRLCDGQGWTRHWDTSREALQKIPRCEALVYFSQGTVVPPSRHFERVIFCCNMAEETN